MSTHPSQEQLYSIPDAIEYMRAKLKKGCRSTLYNLIRHNGIEVKKNGKESYLYRSDLEIMTRVTTITEQFYELRKLHK